MPIYEYRCTKGHTFETFQSMSDDSLTTCEVCEAPVERVLSAPAIHFKGSGFYTTDYAKKGAAANGASAESKSDSKDGSKGDSKDGSKGDSKGSSKGESSSANPSKPKSEGKASE